MLQSKSPHNLPQAKRVNLFFLQERKRHSTLHGGPVLVCICYYTFADRISGSYTTEKHSESRPSFANTRRSGRPINAQCSAIMLSVILYSQRSKLDQVPERFAGDVPDLVVIQMSGKFRHILFEAQGVFDEKSEHTNTYK